MPPIKDTDTEPKAKSYGADDAVEPEAKRTRISVGGTTDDYTRQHEFRQVFEHYVQNSDVTYIENDKNTSRNKPSDSSNSKPMSAATLVSNGLKPKSCTFCDGDHYPTNCVSAIQIGLKLSRLSACVVRVSITFARTQQRNVAIAEIATYAT
jgi:hypothetical protein